MIVHSLPVMLVPLDATNEVRIDQDFVKELKARSSSALGDLSAKILNAAKPLIDTGFISPGICWPPLLVRIPVCCIP